MTQQPYVFETYRNAGINSILPTPQEQTKKKEVRTTVRNIPKKDS